MEKDLEGSDCDLIKVLSRNLPGETVENHENLSHHGQSSGRV
jgi:hypothetical protein